MPLKIELKPNERIIIGDALITNDGERTKFFIEGNAPILREKFIIRQEDANTPCKKIYYVVLQMYLSKTPMDLHKIYFTYMRDVQNAAPSLFPQIMEVNEAIMGGDYYGAIKEAATLVDLETELFGDMLGSKKKSEEVNGNK